MQTPDREERDRIGDRKTDREERKTGEESRGGRGRGAPYAILGEHRRRRAISERKDEVPRCQGTGTPPLIHLFLH